MKFCCELTSGCCGCTIRSTVCIALWHYMLFGLFVVCFVFTNVCYPCYTYPDLIFGGCGAALLVFAFLTSLTVDLKKCQFLRCVMAFVIVLIVTATVASTYYYAIMRWNDVVVTLITSSLRNSRFRDTFDWFWIILTLISCISGPIFLLYLIYIVSFMCNTWKSHLFTSPYSNNQAFSSLPPTLYIPRDDYSTRSYKPYPVQKTN